MNKIIYVYFNGFTSNKIHLFYNDELNLKNIFYIYLDLIKYGHIQNNIPITIIKYRNEICIKFNYLLKIFFKEYLLDEFNNLKIDYLKKIEKNVEIENYLTSNTYALRELAKNILKEI